MPVQIELFSCTSPRFTNSRWGQVLDFPSVYGLVEVQSSGNAQEEGVAYVTRLNRLLSGIETLPKLAILKKKIDTVPVKSLVLCVVRNELCQLSLIGEGKIYLRRGKILAPLLVREGVLSGDIRQNDCLVFLSQTAAQSISSEEKELFSPQLTPKEIAEALSIRFNQKKDQSEGAVAVVLHIHTPTTVTIPKKISVRPSIKEVIQNKTFLIKNIIQRPKFIPYSIVVAITLLFLFSVFLGIRRQQNDTVYKHRQEAVQNAQKMFEEGVALTDIQPIKSRENLQTALEFLSPYVGANLPKGKEGKTIENLQKQIEDSLQVVSRVSTAAVQLFYDASFLQKDRVVSQFTVGEDELAFVDTNAGMVAVVSLTSKDAEIVAGGTEYHSTKFLAFQDNRLLVVTTTGVQAIEAGKEEVKTILKPEDSWDAFTTFGGNLYGVKRSEGVLLRYPLKDSGFGTKEEYFDEDIHPDLSQTSNIVIDGSVWLGSTLGKIFRYTQGRDDPFLIRGVDPPLGQKLDVFVSEDSPTAYIFDPEKKRVVLLSKEGTYQRQFVYGDTIQPTAFGVSPEKKKIFLLSNQKIYSFSIE